MTAEPDWFFGSRHEDNRRKRLQDQAKADLEQYLKYQSGSTSRRSQRSNQNLADKITVSNPLLGIGEKEKIKITKSDNADSTYRKQRREREDRDGYSEPRLRDRDHGYSELRLRDKDTSRRQRSDPEPEREEVYRRSRRPPSREENDQRSDRRFKAPQYSDDDSEEEYQSCKASRKQRSRRFEDSDEDTWRDSAPSWDRRSRERPAQRSVRYEKDRYDERADERYKKRDTSDHYENEREAYRRRDNDDRYGNRQPESRRGRYEDEERSKRLNKERNSAMETQNQSMFPPEGARTDSKDAYRRELEEQIRLKKQKTAAEKSKREAEDRKKEQEMLSYNPFGKEGAGAPMRRKQSTSVPPSSVSDPNPPTQAPTLNEATEPTEAVLTKFIRGATTNIPDWQREEMLRKQRQHQDTQDILKKQMEEKMRLKKLEEEKKKEEDMRELQRLEIERKELEERFKQDELLKAAAAAAAKEKDKAMPVLTPEEAKKKAKEDAMEGFLRAQKEAAELKRSKFLAKRQLGENLRRQSSDMNSTATIAPSTIRSKSPPIPALQKGSEPDAPRTKSPPLPALQKRGSQTNIPGPDATRTETGNQLSVLPPISKAYTPVPMTVPEGIAAAIPLTALPKIASAQKLSQPLQTLPSMSELQDNSALVSIDKKTKAVIEKLSAIKLELDSEREQIRREINRQRLLGSYQARHQDPFSLSPAAKYPTETYPALFPVETPKSPVIDQILAEKDYRIRQLENEVLQKIPVDTYSPIPTFPLKTMEELPNPHQPLQSTSKLMPIGQESLFQEDNQIFGPPTGPEVLQMHAIPIVSRQTITQAHPNTLPNPNTVASPQQPETLGGKSSPASTINVDQVEKLNQARLQRLVELGICLPAPMHTSQDSFAISKAENVLPADSILKDR